MTAPPDLREVAREILEESTKACGVPLHVEDPMVLAKVATKIRTSQKEAVQKASYQADGPD